MIFAVARLFYFQLSVLVTMFFFSAEASTFELYYDPVLARTGLFEPLRFQEPRYFAYAPTVVRGADGIDYMFTCHNNKQGVTRDHIFITYRDESGVLQSNPMVGIDVQPPGMPTYSEAGWDSLHTCDPSVVEGVFTLGVGAQAKTYSWAMFYTGNDNGNGYAGSFHNQVGVAFANDLKGPWVRYPFPVVWQPYSNIYWGVGQPSATAIDAPNGLVLLFYTKGDASGSTTYRREITLRDTATGFGIGPEVKVNMTGLRDFNGNPRTNSVNVDMLYDQYRDQFIMITELAPYGSPSYGYPKFIAAMIEVNTISGANLWSNSGGWKRLTRFSVNHTGFSRNHNAGLGRSRWGSLVDPNFVEAYFSVSCSSDSKNWYNQCPNTNNNSFYSYKVFRTQLDLPPIVAKQNVQDGRMPASVSRKQFKTLSKRSVPTNNTEKNESTKRAKE